MAQEPTGTQGWRQFHSSKERMLAEYDRARSLASIREVQTFHGNVAESELRRWLEGFLPKRFGVTSGYVISQGQRDTTKAPHFDVIIYDALESPVLWIEESSDLSPAGQARGIPAEYVRSVIEVKAAFSTRTVRDALEHLSELEPLLIGVDPSEERYKRYLPPSFFASTVFFEVRKEDQFQAEALNLFGKIALPRGFFGGIILRGEGFQPLVSARVDIAASAQAVASTVAPEGGSLLSPFSFSDFVPTSNGEFMGAVLKWSLVEFPAFAFDTLAALSGTYDLTRVSSFHGMGWPLPPNAPNIAKGGA